MANVRRWSELPADILSVISKILNSKIDFLRLRSVCSSWRSSLSLHRKEICFPLKLPDLRNASARSGYSALEEITSYRLSPPADPSKGWLFKVSEINPNTYSLLHPLTLDRFSSPSGVLPKQLNLLDYRISEICKSYTVKFLDGASARRVPVKKVIALWNYVANCEFAALILHHNGRLSYWRFGDDDWTPVDTKDFEFHDVILFQGKCYALDKSCVLVSFDSELSLSVVNSSGGYRISCNHLVAYESELYIVSRIYPQLHAYIASAALTLMVSKFNKFNGSFDSIGDLGDMVLMLGSDSSLGVSAKDFGGCKGNRVYLVAGYYFSSLSNTESSGVYHLDDGRAMILSQAEDFGKMFLPGSWLCDY